MALESGPFKFSVEVPIKVQSMRKIELFNRLCANLIVKLNCFYYKEILEAMCKQMSSGLFKMFPTKYLSTNDYIYKIS